MEREFWERAKDIFEHAMTLAADDRAKFLDDACSDNDVVRREVEELLSSFDNSAEFMEKPAVHEMASEIAGRGEKLKSGQKLLHYEIIESLGYGGMGEVYL